MIRFYEAIICQIRQLTDSQHAALQISRHLPLDTLLNVSATHVLILMKHCQHKNTSWLNIVAISANNETNKHLLMSMWEHTNSL